MNDKRLNVSNAHQDKFGSQWFNVVLHKNLGLDLGLMISRFGFRLVYVSESTTECCSLLTLGYPQFSDRADVGNFDLPSMLELQGLYRTDGERPDGVTMIPWDMGKQLVWDIKVEDALAPSRLNATGGCSLCNPVTTAIEAEPRKIEKYRELISIDTILIRWPWKYRIPKARAVKISIRVSVKFSVVRKTNHELATYRSNGSQ